jgi:hypothetical protein
MWLSSGQNPAAAFDPSRTLIRPFAAPAPRQLRTLAQLLKGDIQPTSRTGAVDPCGLPGGPPEMAVCSRRSL